MNRENMVKSILAADALTSALRDLKLQIDAHLAYESTHPEVSDGIIKDFENTTEQIRDTILFYQLTRKSQ